MKTLNYKIFKSNLFIISFLSFLFVCGIVSLSYQSKISQAYKESLKHSHIEITYKASSPKGGEAGVSLPASCESDYYHPTGGVWPTPDGNSTNNAAATRLDYGWVRRLNYNGYCVRNDNGSSIFLNADHGNFINGAPGVSKVTTGDL